LRGRPARQALLARRVTRAILVLLVQPVLPVLPVQWVRRVLKVLLVPQALAGLRVRKAIRERRQAKWGLVQALAQYAAGRAGIKWMRERYRAVGQTPGF
jgi:hypothetical protein